MGTAPADGVGLLTVPLFSVEAGGVAIPAAPHSALAKLQAATPLATVPGTTPGPGTSTLVHLPCRLHNKIAQLEFVEMSELLPEAWSATEPQDAPSSSLRLPTWRSPVTDIVVWTERFSLMAAVIVEEQPDKAAHMFAYLRRVTRAARNFQEAAWVAYDRMYRRQALARGSLDWGVEDPGLCSEAFVG